MYNAKLLIASRKRKGEVIKEQFLPKGLGFQKGSPSRQGLGIKNVVEEGLVNERSRMQNKTKQKNCWF